MTLHLWNECICLMNAAVKCCLLVYGQQYQQTFVLITRAFRWILWIKPISWRCIRFFENFKIQTSKTYRSVYEPWLLMSNTTSTIDTSRHRSIFERHHVLRWERPFQCKCICLITFNSQINKALFQVCVYREHSNIKSTPPALALTLSLPLSLKSIAKRIKMYMRQRPTIRLFIYLFYSFECALDLIFGGLP